MPLNPVGLGLRTIHNGSHDVAKASITVPAGGELTVPADVADQLQRDGAFKDGPPTDELLASLAEQPFVVDNVLIDPTAEVLEVDPDSPVPGVVDVTDGPVGEGVQDPASGDAKPVVKKKSKPAAASKSKE